MRPINNWNNIQPAQMGEKAKLPVGAYICRIKQAKVETTNYNGITSERLCIAFDIADGEYADFFGKQFEASTYADKKWKGVFRQKIPTGDGSDKDQTTASYFKGVITAIEESNPGYTFNFDENTLQGKNVGILFREEEYEYNGYRGMAVKPFIMMSAAKVAAGDYTIPTPKILQSSNATPSAQAFGFGMPPMDAPIPTEPNFTAISADENLPF